MDLLIVTLVFVATSLVGAALGLPGAGTGAVVIACLAATLFLVRDGTGWPGVGLRLPASWWRTLGWVLAIYAAVMLVNLFVVGPLARAMDWPALNLARFERLHGQPWALLGWLLLVWTTAALGEELLFRGYLLNRLQALTSWPAWVAVALQAMLFGVAHAYLGVRGVVTATAVGLVFGAAYQLNGRQLLPLILAHGIIDSISIIAIYAAGTARLTANT